jgi:hypothetical protein
LAEQLEKTAKVLRERKIDLLSLKEKIDREMSEIINVR